MVGSPSRMSLRGAMPFRMSGSCRVSLSDVRECSEGPLGCPGVVGGLTRMSGSGREILPDVWVWLGGPSGCAEGPPGCPRVVGCPARMFGSGREALLEVL